MWKDPTLGFEKDAEGPFCDLFMPTNMAGFFMIGNGNVSIIYAMNFSVTSYQCTGSLSCEGLKYVSP
jgi:hypothetical protein